MKHFGDITKLSGYTLPIVDVITGGSPCQDLSVAGKRAGLAGERSGLFMEQMRIVKEMRERDRKSGRTGWMVRPRYMVWENVPGAFSSGKPKGADFAAVIEEIIKVAEPGASVSVCVPDGGWTKSGCYYAEDGSWSIAWRVHDAQLWGVPQRRKRISLVADFGGLSAPEILFERKGLSGDSEQGGAKRKEAAGAVGGGAEGASGLTNRGYYTGDVTETLRSDPHGAYPCVGVGVYNQEITGDVAASLTAASGGTNTSGPKVLSCGFKPRQGAAARSLGFEQEKSPTINTDENYAVLCLNDQGGSVMDVSEDVTGALRAEEHGHQPSVVTYDARGNGDGKTVCTITGDHQNRVTDYTALCVGNGQLNQMSMAEQANTLDTMHDQQAVMIAAANGFGGYSVGVGTLRAAGGDHGGGSEMLIAVVDCRNGTENPNINGTLQAKSTGGTGTNFNNVLRANAIVRRLTPLECERLQGYPDGWTDIGEWVDSKGKKHKDADSPRYKALGNSIALPFWQWMARRICAQYERPVTMASLFDGIGGFPLVFSRCGATPVWASEIEEFPIAVTKVRFPDESV